MCSTTLAPCVIFYFRGAGEFRWFIAFIGISYLVSLFPKTFYDRFQISTDLKAYKRLKVDVFKKLSTNGDLADSVSYKGPILRLTFFVVIFPAKAIDENYNKSVYWEAL